MVTRIHQPARPPIGHHNCRRPDSVIVALHKQALAKGLSQAVRATNYWWKDGKPVAKDALVEAIDNLGDNYIRRVVVVQPHVTEAARTKAEAAKTGVDRLRLDQLNTLLASAWRSCNGLGAEFKVIWAQ